MPEAVKISDVDNLPEETKERVNVALDRLAKLVTDGARLVLSTPDELIDAAANELDAFKRSLVPPEPEPEHPDGLADRTVDQEITQARQWLKEFHGQDLRREVAKTRIIHPEMGTHFNALDNAGKNQMLAWILETPSIGDSDWRASLAAHPV